VDTGSLIWDAFFIGAFSAICLYGFFYDTDEGKSDAEIIALLRNKFLRCKA